MERMGKLLYSANMIKMLRTDNEKVGVEELDRQWS